MNLSLASFCWAKKHDRDGYKWLPLSIHLEDTANIMAFLWEEYLSKGQKNIVMESINSSDDFEGLSLAIF